MAARKRGQKPPAELRTISLFSGLTAMEEQAQVNEQEVEEAKSTHKDRVPGWDPVSAAGLKAAEVTGVAPTRRRGGYQLVRDGERFVLCVTGNTSKDGTPMKMMIMRMDQHELDLLRKAIA